MQDEYCGLAFTKQEKEEYVYYVPEKDCFCISTSNYGNNNFRSTYYMQDCFLGIEEINKKVFDVIPLGEL